MFEILVLENAFPVATQRARRIHALTNISVLLICKGLGCCDLIKKYVILLAHALQVGSQNSIRDEGTQNNPCMRNYHAIIAGSEMLVGGKRCQIGSLIRKVRVRLEFSHHPSCSRINGFKRNPHHF